MEAEISQNLRCYIAIWNSLGKKRSEKDADWPCDHYTHIARVRESMKVLDSGSRPLDSGFQLSGFRNPYHSGFRIPNHCGFRIPVLWIPDSNSKNLLDSGFRILLHGATHRSSLPKFDGIRDLCVTPGYWVQCMSFQPWPNGLVSWRKTRKVLNLRWTCVLFDTHLRWLQCSDLYHRVWSSSNSHASWRKFSTVWPPNPTSYASFASTCESVWPGL